MKLLLATTSSGKLREQQAALQGLDLDLVSLSAWPELPPPDEDGETFEENAVRKALYYHRATGLPTVAEDAGLEVDALGGSPGVHSSRWLGAGTPYHVKNGRLLEELSGLSEDERTARYVSALVLAEGGRIVWRTRQSCDGRISETPRGEGGFGYDPIFFYPPFGKTFAEVPAEEKSRVSHRGKAVAELRRYLEERLEIRPGRSRR